MEYQDILHRCFRCGYCKLPSDYTDLTCPSYVAYRFETFSPGGRLWLLRAWLNGEIKTSPRLGEILFSCASCANCVEHCAFPKFKDDILEAIIAGRAEMTAEGLVPPAVRDYFKAMHVSGNPYKLPAAERGRWAEGLDVRAYDGQDYLFYIGDVGSYDERARKMARAAARVLTRLGVSFGVLGVEEKADGNEARTMGESGLFEMLARQCLESFRQRGVRRVVTLSPHAYHAFRRLYPALGAGFETFHYSQVLAAALAGAKRSADHPPIKAAFHDPCYLGRHNQEYLAPRRVLSGLSGVSLVEMDRSRQNALCCGGGGGNFFTDLLGRGPDAPAKARALEAHGAGAEVLAVACPQCLKMLEDAVKAVGLEDRLRVADLAELALERL